MTDQPTIISNTKMVFPSSSYSMRDNRSELANEKSRVQQATIQGYDWVMASVHQQCIMECFIGIVAIQNFMEKSERRH